MVNRFWSTQRTGNTPCVAPATPPLSHWRCRPTMVALSPNHGGGLHIWRLRDCSCGSHSADVRYTAAHMHIWRSLNAFDNLRVGQAMSYPRSRASFRARASYSTMGSFACLVPTMGSGPHNLEELERFRVAFERLQSAPQYAYSYRCFPIYHWSPG